MAIAIPRVAKTKPVDTSGFNSRQLAVIKKNPNQAQNIFNQNRRTNLINSNMGSFNARQQAVLKRDPNQVNNILAQNKRQNLISDNMGSLNTRQQAVIKKDPNQIQNILNQNQRTNTQNQEVLNAGYTLDQVPKRRVVKTQGGLSLDTTYLNDGQAKRINDLIAKGRGLEAQKLSAQWNTAGRASWLKAGPGQQAQTGADTTQPTPDAPAAPPPPVQGSDAVLGQPSPQQLQAEEAAKKQASDYMNFMFKQSQGFDQNPDYVLQKDQGKKELEQFLASQGLTGSGYAADRFKDYMTTLNAAEQRRLNDVQESQSGRLYQMMKDEADRQQVAGDSQWGRIRDLMNFYGQQNPMQYVGSSVGAAGDLAVKRGGTLADYYKDMYSRPSLGVSSGGGGGASPGPFIPAFPGSPDYTQADMAAALMGGGSGSTASILSGIGNSVGSFLPYLMMGRS